MSTIKFDHSKKSFPEALGLNEEDVEQLAKTMARMMEHAAKNDISQSEKAEMIAKTCSFTEILMMATDGFDAKMQQAVDHFKGILGDDLSDEDDIEEFERKLKERFGGVKSSIRKIEIDPTDIDGSLDRAGVPDDLKSELKLRILKEMRDRLSDQED